MPKRNLEVCPTFFPCMWFFHIDTLENISFSLGLLTPSPTVKEYVRNMTNVVGEEHECNPENFIMDSSTNSSSVLEFQNQVSVSYKSLIHLIAIFTKQKVLEFFFCLKPQKSKAISILSFFPRMEIWFETFCWRDI